MSFGLQVIGNLVGKVSAASVMLCYFVVHEIAPTGGRFTRIRQRCQSLPNSRL